MAAAGASAAARHVDRRSPLSASLLLHCRGLVPRARRNRSLLRPALPRLWPGCSDPSAARRRSGVLRRALRCAPAGGVGGSPEVVGGRGIGSQAHFAPSGTSTRCRWAGARGMGRMSSRSPPRAERPSAVQSTMRRTPHGQAAKLLPVRKVSRRCRQHPVKSRALPSHDSFDREGGHKLAPLSSDDEARPAPRGAEPCCGDHQLTSAND